MLSLVIWRTIRIIGIIFLFFLSNGCAGEAAKSEDNDVKVGATIVQLVCIGISCWLVW